VPAKNGQWRVVQVGTIEPRKRPSDVIRAVSRLDADVECAICGKFFEIDKDAEAIIRADPQRYRLVEGLPDEEILAWTESADVFVLASASETQGLAAYEAALLGRPLILSDLLCYRSIFAHGQNCLLFPQGNVEMLAQSIAMLLGAPDLARQLSLAGQRTARRFTNEAFHVGIEALIYRTLAQFPRRPA
jgi:glycosyltransferase involved in cell wall biosynthesis